MTEAQKAAQKRYREKNKEKYTRMSNKATAKVYIKSATLEELSEIKIWIKERMETKMEKFTVNGQIYEVELKQEPYLTGTSDKPYYEVHAVDAEENGYIVRWDILGDYDPADGDEGLSCEWNKPVSIEKIY